MKSVLVFALIIWVELGVSQSSIQMLISNSTQTLNNGAVISLTTAIGQETKQIVDIRNISINTTNTYKVKRKDVVLNNGADAYFCFGGSCYGPGTPDAPNALSLNAGQKASDLNSQQNPYYPLSADIYEGGTAIAFSEVYYKFYNVANPNDTASFTIKYNALPVGIAVHKTESDYKIYQCANQKSVTVTRKSTEPAKGQICNIEGKPVFQFNCNSEQTDLQLQTLDAGFYTLRLSNSNAIFKIILP
ncbi:MAG: hypothetical protein RIR05_106 [Bacteroidota bacterium]|jgi:hypothetical protein|nr:T9SS C-terminal target domain-containing protein [Sphingobacteriia bacterium]